MVLKIGENVAELYMWLAMAYGNLITVQPLLFSFLFSVWFVDVCWNMKMWHRVCCRELSPQLIHLISMHHLIYPLNKYCYENNELERIVSIDINYP